MRRITTLLTLLLSIALAIPALAQGSQVDPIDEFLKAVQAPENQAYIAQFLREPMEGKGVVMDPMGDFGHSTGNPPGYTPEFIDILDAWAEEIAVGGPPLFGPTDGSDPLWMTGNKVLELPDGMPMGTYTIDSTDHDGSQYEDGAYFFGVTVAGVLPLEHPGRCEIVVWINDLSQSTVWENRPSFPDDPAGGTNMAFGIGINPPGQGESSTFTLDYDGSSFLARNEYDVRGFIVDDYAGIFVPRMAIPDLGGVNFYTFCVDEGFSFDASDTGADWTGLIEMTPADFGLLSIELTDIKTTTSTTEATTTTSESATTTTVAATTTVAETTATTVVPAEESDDGGGFPWWILVFGGLGLAIAGWLLANREGGDPCAELLEAWKAAQAKCDKAIADATEARAKCDDAKGDVEDLEDERKELCKEWPPACLPDGSDGAWVEDDQGNRVTSRDLHLRRQALGSVWSDYKAGNLSAQEVQQKWEEADTPEFRHDMRAKDAAAKEELQEIDGDLTTARDAAKKACGAAEKAEAAAKAACDKAAAAKRAYEECVGTALAADSTGGGDAGETGGGTPGGQPGVATGGEQSQADPCDGQPPRKVEPAGRAETIRVDVDFSMIAETVEGSERNVAAGEQMVTDLNTLARELDVVGDLLSAREAGSSIGGGINGLSQGTYVRGTAGIIKGGVGTYLAAADTSFDVPTSIPTAIVETLESITKMTSAITASVTRWMDNYQLSTARITYFTQTVTATPYTVWECRKGVGYVCVEKVWEISVSKLGKRPGPRAREFRQVSEIGRWRQQREWERISKVALNKVTRDAQRLITWQEQHGPGPCQP